MQRRQLRISSLAVALCLLASACSSSSDTTQVAASDDETGARAPTTSIVSEQLRSTTTTTIVSATPAITSSGPAGLAALLQRFAVDPALVGELQGLDLSAVAGLLGADPAVLEDLGLSPAQLQALGTVVVDSPPAVQGGLDTDQVDPTLLLSLLVGPLDLNALTSGGVAAIVRALVDSIGGVGFVVDPQVTLDLGELLDQIDPDGLGPVAADPSNAALLALITSAIISANPLLTLQLLSNPLLDQDLKSLLTQLADLNASLNDASRAALLAAIGRLFPDLLPS